MKLKLITMCLSSHTIGKLYIDGEMFSYSLELPDRDNEVNKSCIPAGTYYLVKNYSPRFGHGYRVTMVTGRSQILIHAGNTVIDTRGCILLGEETGVLTSTGKEAVLVSRRTVINLFDLLDSADEAHTIEVIRL